MEAFTHTVVSLDDKNEEDDEMADVDCDLWLRFIDFNCTEGGGGEEK